MSDPLQDHTTPPPVLLPIGTAPRDGTFIIAYTKPALEDRWMGMANGPFAIKHMGRTTASGLDLGWSLFPGMGVSDNWFEGWMPITRAAATAQEAQPILMIYRNWRGEVAQRRIRPAGLPYWATTEWHTEPGWLLPAIDAEKGEYRDFALKDCDFTIARQAEPGVICNGCGWEGDEDGLIATLDSEDGEPCRACPDCGTDGYLMDRRAQPEADFPQPSRKDGGEPCGECRLPAGETCDICGAVALTPSAATSLTTGQMRHAIMTGTLTEAQPAAPQPEGQVRILCLPYPMHGYGVCVGGRYDGWLMWQHPDGQWVTKANLESVDPRALAEGHATQKP